MLARRSCDFSLLRAFKSTRRLEPCRDESTKGKKVSKKGKQWIERKTEEQLLFGKLLETKREKEKRIKSSQDGQIKSNGASPSSINAELMYISPFSTLKIIKKSNEQKRPVVDAIDESDQAVANAEAQSKAQCTINDSRGRDASDVLYKKKTDPNMREKNAPEPLLSKALVQQLPEFPIYQQLKAFNDNWSADSKVMSISASEEPSCLKYPSVTKILSATMSEEMRAVLEKWKIRMIEKMGLRGFEIYQAELLQDGKLLHSAIMNALHKKSAGVSDRIKRSLSSLTQVLDHVDSVRALESHVIHPVLKYRGIVDCIASFRGEVCLIDWKKSDKEKQTIGSTYDAPFQLASYIGALNADLKYPFQVKKGLIVVAYTNGNPATVHELNGEKLQLFWKVWLHRLQEYHVRSTAGP